MELQTPFFPGAAEGPDGGSGTRNSAAMTKRKLKASRKKAEAAPSDFVIIPAGAGPTIPASSALLCHTELAAGSCSGWTRERSRGPAEGMAKASATPNAEAST